MILELADLTIRPGEQDAFDAAIRRGVEGIIARAQGFRGYKVNRGVESPDRYLLMIFWDTLENHVVDFRNSAAFAEWRAVIGPYLAGSPQVEHFTLVCKSNGS